MADMKTGIFAKNVQKRLNRAQEKVRSGAGEPWGGVRGRKDAAAVPGLCERMRLRSPAAAASPVLARGAGAGPAGLVIT